MFRRGYAPLGTRCGTEPSNIEQPLASLAQARLNLARSQEDVERLERLEAQAPSHSGMGEAVGVDVPALAVEEEFSMSSAHSLQRAELDALRAQLSEEVRRRQDAEEEARRLRRAVPVRTQQLLRVQTVGGICDAFKPNSSSALKPQKPRAAPLPLTLTAANLHKVAAHQAQVAAYHKVAAHQQRRQQQKQQPRQQPRHTGVLQGAVQKPRRVIKSRDPVTKPAAGMGKAALVRRAASWEPRDSSRGSSKSTAQPPPAGM